MAGSSVPANRFQRLKAASDEMLQKVTVEWTVMRCGGKNWMRISRSLGPWPGVSNFRRKQRNRWATAAQAIMDQTERGLLENALKAARGDQTAAAAALGMKPSTFRDKLAKHGL